MKQVNPALKSLLDFLKRIVTTNPWLKILSFVLACATYTTLYDSPVNKDKTDRNKIEQPMYTYFHNAQVPLPIIQTKPTIQTNSTVKVNSSSTNSTNKEIKKK